MHAARLATEKADFRPALPMCLYAGLIGQQMATKLTYKEQLLDPRWQRKRLEILQRDEFICQVCFDGESTLHVHHKHYHKGRMPWEYEDEELVTLCASCHEGMDEQSTAIKSLFAKLRVDGPYSVDEAIALIAGWADNYCGFDLSEFADRSPWNFILGEIAGVLDIYALEKGMLQELSDRLRGVDGETRLEALKALIDSLPPSTNKPKF